MKFYAILLCLLLLTCFTVNACSTYKVTVGDKTMVGSNYDAWYTTPHIWFETKGYGCSFSGGRAEDAGKYAPQTALNIHGLAFVTLATATPNNGTVEKGKKTIPNRSNYLKDIMHTCRNVQEVKAYVEQYDHSVLSGDVFLYVDKEGNYLVVEPYTTILGSEPKYVLANFCPSTIEDFSTIKQKRYVDGVSFLANKIDTSLQFCKALSDTMHVCRAGHGDGTLLTSVLDLKRGIINLYFYHDYSHHVKFNLNDELAKGDHIIPIASLFPPNKEFMELASFKTPMNNYTMDMFLRVCFGLFFVSGLYFFISFFAKMGMVTFNYFKVLLMAVSMLLLFYTFLLSTQQSIYYFPAPYRHYSSAVISAASYIPFLMLLFIIPSLVVNYRVLKNKLWPTLGVYMLMLNNAVYLVLIALFVYWGLYNVV